jgi:hypothetical protein
MIIFVVVQYWTQTVAETRIKPRVPNVYLAVSENETLNKQAARVAEVCQE